MKTIDIESKKKILKKAKKVLNCILEAKRRIEYSENTIKRVEVDIWGTIAWNQRRIEAHKAAIVKLESYYRKIVSQL
jgi:hypothetical protein